MTAVVLAALLYPAVALNLRLAGDSRFDVEAWMREHFTDDPSILAVGSQLYLPNLYPYQHRIVQRASVAEILTWNANVLVINEDWLERPGQPSDETIERELGEARYRRVVRRPGGRGREADSGASWPADCTSIRCSRISPRRARRFSISVRDAASTSTFVVATLSPSPPPGLAGHVVFHSSREGRNKLFIVDVATGVVTPLTSGAGHHDEDPSWSPDGLKVAFASNRFDQTTFDIAVVDRRDSSVSRVTSHAAFEQHPTWATDSRTVLFSSEQDGTQAVFEARVDGTDITRVSAPPERALMPAEAPGGLRVAFTAGTPDGLQVLLRDRASRTDRRLTGGPVGAARPRWSPDGSRLAYFRLGSPGRYVEVLDVASARAVPIRVEGLASLSDPDWSPDGRFLVATGAREAGDGADWDLRDPRRGDPGPRVPPDDRRRQRPRPFMDRSVMGKVAYGFTGAAAVAYLAARAILVPSPTTRPPPSSATSTKASRRSSTSTSPRTTS